MTELATQVFSDFRWKDLPNTGLKHRSCRSWTELHALAVEAYETTREYCALSLEEWRALIDMTNSGLPITLKWKGHRLTTTATCIVDQFLSLSKGTTANLYVRHCGFNHPLALTDLVSAEVPPTTYESID